MEDVDLSVEVLDRERKEHTPEYRINRMLKQKYPDGQPLPPVSYLL